MTDPAARKTLLDQAVAQHLAHGWSLLAAAVVALLVPALALGAQRPGAIRVYVPPIPGDVAGFVDPQTQRMQDSHQDLISRLRTRKALVVVETPEAADCVVTLTSAGWEPFGFRPHAPLIETVRATVAAGDYEREYFGQRQTWRGAALVLAASIERWAKDNRETLLARRSGLDP